MLCTFVQSPISLPHKQHTESSQSKKILTIFKFRFQYCRPYRSLSEINDRKVDWIETILQDHNKQYGRRPCAVIPSEHFLASLTPSHDQVGADWRQAWEELRSMYAQGTI